MIYIPMLKTRDEEFRVLKSMKECYSDKIIPLIEVISEQYQVRYKTDEKRKNVIHSIERLSVRQRNRIL